jgi:PEP-CTERM motif
MIATAGPVTVTQTTTGATLATALGGGGGMTIGSVTIANGAASQFGTYTNFTSLPVTIGNGVVLSTGQVVQVTPAFNNGLQGGATTPSTNTGAAGTAEFNAYGPGHITNFANSNDVAAMLVNFTLSSASQVGFDFIFGSVESPQFTSSFTDAFVAFLDGTGTPNQIVFDPFNNAVQVGATFASALTTADTNTAFANPHGLVKLTTFTVGQLSAGSHSILFEVGDVNDHILDSAVFISNLHAGAGTGGTGPAGAPEPATLALVGLSLAALAGRRWRKAQ